MDYFLDDLEMISTLTSLTEAIRYSIRKSKLNEKQVYMEMGIDAGQWTRIVTHVAHFPHERFLELFSITGNLIPLQYLAYKAGFELRPLQSALEYQNDTLKKEKENLQRQLDSLFQLLRARGLDI
ncbi:MAG: hypothetical protein A3E87_01750 [Gammaproteobacteria bacterium RIFCSPHIGHO2_12_FULL_35_23]|nr:MAG: hypothetical protein A3E87_01750 [Gammaproteobacteria bacterium RIFCSPHIGHO2_12_FULL_35_23]